MKKNKNGQVNISFTLDMRAYVKLARQARSRGITIERHIADTFPAFFVPPAVDLTRSGKVRPRR